MILQDVVVGNLTTSWPGIASPEDGVASLAYVPAIHVLLIKKKGVDARHKAGHDVEG
jgi:hypothetical protein